MEIMYICLKGTVQFREGIKKLSKKLHLLYPIYWEMI